MKNIYSIVWLLVTSACIDQGFHTKDDDVIGPDTDTDGHTDTDTELPPGEEVCNGEDDDGDGLIDEDFADRDGDGIADCVDEDCEVTVPPERELEVDEECGGGGAGTITDPWDVATEWTWVGSGFNDQHSAIPPLVANLTDTDGDGAITLKDTPNVVLITIADDIISGSLTVLEGDTGTEVWQVSDIYGVGGHAVGDVDGDGEPEVVAFDDSLCVVAYSASGVKEWTSSFCSSTSMYPQAVIADLNGDGGPEVVTDKGILDGRTGALVASLSIDTFDVPYTMPAVGDIDLDGIQEIVLGNKVFSSDGSVEWSTSVSGDYGHWSVIINADADSEAEVAMVASGMLTIFEHDGTVKYSSSAGSNGASPPCAADFDGDGETEIAWASQGTFHVFDLDGTEVWQTAVFDFSGVSGCSGYDIDGNGAYEILYADEATVYIFDGTTGAERYKTNSHASGTLFEYPTIADVDNDGSAEVLYVSNYFLSGSSGPALTVLGHNGDGWAKSGPTWPVFDFAVSNIQPDGTIPSSPPAYWLDYNVYRARPIVDSLGVDLGVAVADVCFSGCMEDSVVKVVVQVGNRGVEDSGEFVPVSLYAVTSGELTLIETQLIPSVILSGTLQEGITFQVTAAYVGEDGFMVRVDDDGTGSGIELECDENNNEDIYIDNPC